MTSVFTPYMARFTTGDNEYYVTLDRGITVVEAARDVYGELETELVERFKSTFSYRGALMVIKDYGFPGFMHDEEALAISLATLSVHKGRVKSVSQALKAFYPKFEKNERKLKIQFFGGMYDAKSFSRIHTDSQSQSHRKKKWKRGDIYSGDSRKPAIQGLRNSFRDFGRQRKGLHTA
jgi:hypothetical protein